jgi:hypothetical protein
MDLNYFSILSIAWALVGILTRILMTAFGERWNEWEMSSAYKKERPGWVVIVSLLGILLVAFTWYQVMNTEVAYAWIIAALLTVTLVKISALLFRYEAFRRFASEVLTDPAKKKQLTISVFLLSLVMLWMGIFLYGGGL